MYNVTYLAIVLCEAAVAVTSGAGGEGLWGGLGDDADASDSCEVDGYGLPTVAHRATKLPAFANLWFTCTHGCVLCVGSLRVRGVRGIS